MLEGFFNFVITNAKPIAITGTPFAMWFGGWIVVHLRAGGMSYMIDAEKGSGGDITVGGRANRHVVKDTKKMH